MPTDADILSWWTTGGLDAGRWAVVGYWWRKETKMKSSTLELTADLLELILALPEGTKVVGAEYKYGWPVDVPDILRLKIVSKDFPDGARVTGNTSRHECEGKTWVRTVLAPY